MFCPLACIFPSVQDQGIEMRVIEEGTHHSLLHRLNTLQNATPGIQIPTAKQKSQRKHLCNFEAIRFDLFISLKSNLASSLKSTDNHILSQFNDCNFSLCYILNPTLTDS